MYSDNSKITIAFITRSKMIAEPTAIVLPTSSVHHAHRSPLRNAVIVIATAIKPKTTLKMPYIRKIMVMKSVVAGDVAVSADNAEPVKPAYSASRIGVPPGPSSWPGRSAAIAPHANIPTSVIRISTNAILRLRFVRVAFVGNPFDIFIIVCIGDIDHSHNGISSKATEVSPGEKCVYHVL